ncbi:hypothetical protein [Pedobacter africanus]|uniref:Uncharacterized protein n=1 Tax=Pedobacter africanus TaxID=151894 RepID=A0A1W2CQC9_9SPHI|nr:hypothetical protein [Pedobacter africanus]SMC87465.1 hypothetical protein SAMN04488524_3094 [Pedobacter africanus]
MVAIKLICLTLLVATALGCKKPDPENKETIKANEVQNDGSTSLTAAQERYIVFFLTNTSVDQADSENTGKDANSAYTFVGELPQIFGPVNTDAPYKYAFGLPGPMLLTQSVQQMQYQVNKAFDIAEKYNVPVYFQLDDINNYTTEFGGGAMPKFYNDPSWCEWVSFPSGTETWGGQSNGRLPYYWFNWGAWMHAQAFPNLQSPGFRAFIKSQLENGVLSVLNTRYNQLKANGKGYLFAGMAIGWETHIPDYSADNTLYNVNPSSLPVNVILGDQMQSWEAGKLGFAALHTLGYTAYNKDRLYQVIHDYSEFLAKTAYDTGIPREKIFSHIVGIKSSQPGLSTTFAPPIWTAVNNYSTPGFTLSPVSCPYNLNTLKAEISLADSQQKNFANAEGYSIGVNGSFAQADAYFGDMFGHGASMVAVFGWGREPASSAFAVSHSPASPFVQAAKKWLSNEVKVWSFAAGAEGWTSGNDISGFGWNNAGKIGGSLTGNDAFILSANSVGYNLGTEKLVQVGISNASANTVGQVYFTTTASTGWSEDKRKDFAMTANSSLTNYTINMADIPTWQGTLKQLRIDPSNAVPGSSTSGNFSIDYIHVGSQGWNFMSASEGWTAGQQINNFGWSAAAGNYIGGKLTGADAFIVSADNLNLILANCRYVVVRIKNSSPQTIGQVYFTTTTDLAWNNAKQVSFALNPYSDFTTYTIDMSTVPGWTGTLKQLRIDPSNATPGTPVNGYFQVQYIKIVN